MGPSIEFDFNIDDIVVTCFSDEGIIKILAYEKDKKIYGVRLPSGIQYFETEDIELIPCIGSTTEDCACSTQEGSIL